MRVMFSPSWSRSPSVAVLAAGFAFSLALGTIGVISVISAAPASAHTALVSITPKANERLTTVPTRVVLEFNEPVSKAFATVAVRNAAGAAVVHGKPTVLGTKVTQPLSPNLASGNYRVVYRVVSGDGHPVSGESRFTVAVTSAQRTAVSVATPSPALAAPPTPKLAAPPAPRDRDAGQGGGLSRFLVPIAGAIGLALIGGGVVRWDRQRRRT